MEEELVVLAAVVAGIWALLLWLSVVVWVYRDTLEEAYARSLEEEALLRELGDEGSCPSCRRLVDKDFQFCPSCQTQLRDQCAKCERLLSFAWVACPSCGTVRPGAAATAPSGPVQVPSGEPTQTEQEPLEASPAAQEAEATRFQH
jgi:RNA polymerase subunit RPABC4/transcription elongation factor Spt4